MYPSKRDFTYGIFMKNIVIGLGECNCSVWLISIKGRSKTIIEKVIKYLNFYLRILFTDLKKYDILYLSFPSHTYFPFLFKNIHSKMVIRLHGSDLFPEKSLKAVNRILSELTLRAVKKSDLTVVPSNYFKNELRRIINVKNVFTNPSGGVDKKKFFYYKISKKIFTIGYVGKISENKGILVLLEALRYLEFPYKLIIIGEGPLTNFVKKYCIDNGLDCHVFFLGIIKNDMLVNYYNRFNVFVFPTLRRSESFGNVAIEAMACGVPIIGSKTSGLLDYIKDKKNGYFFEPGNALDLADKINEYKSLSDEEKLRIRDCALKTSLMYEKSFISEKFVTKLKSLLD
jgi:glycosyltransferase involved in cell wall biosynthesis